MSPEPREIHWSGFGFQVWLQILLQLARGNGDSVLVLDEPDIYLHADLQRRLLRLVGERFPQYFIATCSIPDDHIEPRRSAFFMARSVLRDIRSGVRAC